jgi:alcohol dehydrogenase (quinone), cytochrome c subunit
MTSRSLLRTTLLAAGVLAALAVGALALSAGNAPETLATVAAQGDASADLIARGAYLAHAGDCAACHTNKGGEPFAGGLPLASPMGVIYATNITPDTQHGIGRYSEADFANAVRRGVRRDGSRLYPAMPYPDYAAISDADIHALYTFFMKGVRPVATPSPTTRLTFPFNQRWGMAGWDIAFAPPEHFAPTPGATPAVERGKYLVQTLGHCSSCHSPRGIAMQEKALDDSSPRFLSGGDLNGWPVPSLRGMPGWSLTSIVDYLATGRNDFASVGGEMTGVVQHSTQYLSESDLTDIATYLKSLPAGDSTRNVRKHAQAATDETTRQLTAAHDLDRGQALYLDNCESCHLTDGRGAKGIFPRINGGDVVVADDPTGLINIILDGAQTPSTPRAPSVMAMPGFSSRLTDADVAELATFVRSGWANQAGPVSIADVAKVRATLDTMHAKQVTDPAVIAKKPVPPSRVKP